MALIEAKKEAERPSSVKSAFLFLMSHELFTPLNFILGISKLVVADPGVLINDDQAAAMAQILSSGGHLMNLLDDSLNLSIIKAVQFWVSAERVDTKATCVDGLLFLQPLAKVKALSVTRKFRVHFSIVAYTKSLKQILIIEVFLENRVRMPVVDIGLGMPPDNTAGFPNFLSVWDENRKILRGLGGGLIITKRLVEVLGGTIDFISEPGNGSGFWIAFSGV